MAVSINKLKSYFQKVGPLTAATDFQTINVNDPDQLFNFEKALGAPSLSNYFKFSMEISPQNAELRRQFPDESEGSANVDLNSFRERTLDKNLKECKNLEQWLTEAGCFDSCYKGRRMELLASEANLPGTNMQVVQEVGSRQGIRERFASQRQYTDIAVSFYVTHDYSSLRFFQEWTNFMNPLYIGISGQTFPTSHKAGYPNATDRNAFHRFRYPHTYKRDIQITKFERDVNLGVTGKVDSGLKEWTTDMDIEEEGKPIYDSAYQPSVLSYNFVNAYPTAIKDIQLSFGAAQVLKVTVDFSYDRYFLVQSQGGRSRKIPAEYAAAVPLGITPEVLSRGENYP